MSFLLLRKDKIGANLLTINENVYAIIIITKKEIKEEDND